MKIVKENTKEIERAKKIIEICKRRIKSKASFFVYVLSILKYIPVEDDVLLCTDGENIYFNAKKVVKEFQNGTVYNLEWTLFHILLHGVLGHFENTEYTRKSLAWAVMDLQVERLLRLIYPGAKNRINSYLWGNEEDADLLDEDFLANELYYKGLKDKKLKNRILRKGKEILIDDHKYWYDKPKKIKADEMDEKTLEKLEKMERIRVIWTKARVFICEEEKEEKKSDGKNVEGALKVLVRSKKQGHGSLNEGNNVSYQEESKNSYQEILKEILSVSEESKDSDSIDKALYMYGLELYGDMPIVEPEEIEEKRQIHTMILAVDTSGSCTDNAKVFLREMTKLLVQIREQVSIDHLCYLECDDEIVYEKNYYEMDYFTGFGKNHTFMGGGGTSFVPVFDRAQELIDKGEKIDVLFYFSDCEGDFPNQEPAYPAIFLMDNDSPYEFLNIPKWVKVIEVKI